MQSLLSKKIQARRRLDFRLHQPSYFSKSSFLGPRSLKGYSTAEKKPILFNMRFGASCVYVYLIFRGISMLTTRNKRKNMFLHNFSTFFPSSLPRVVVFRLRWAQKLKRKRSQTHSTVLRLVEKLLHFNSNLERFYFRLFSGSLEMINLSVMGV